MFTFYIGLVIVEFLYLCLNIECIKIMFCLLMSLALANGMIILIINCAQI